MAAFDPALCQGTGAEVFLQQWGRWARSGDLGLGISDQALIRKAGLGYLFSDEVMLQIDRVVASLPLHHKQVLLRAHLHCDYRGLDWSQVTEAADVFAKVFFNAHPQLAPREPSKPKTP